MNVTRHEMPTNRSDPLAHQNIRDRFYGQEDPVAAKMLAKQDEIPTLTPPQDEGITSLWLGNMSPEITQEVIHPPQEVASVKIRKCVKFSRHRVFV